MRSVPLKHLGQSQLNYWVNSSVLWFSAHGPMLENHPTVNADEVRRYFVSMRGKLSSIDNILCSILKSCADIFSQVIARLACLSLAFGVFPQRFKTASTKPLIKSWSWVNRSLLIIGLSYIQDRRTSLSTARRQRRQNQQTAVYLQTLPLDWYGTVHYRLLDEVYGNVGHTKASVLAALDTSAAFDTLHKPANTSTLEVHLFYIWMWIALLLLLLFIYFTH